MVMITPSLESKLKGYKLDISRDWTPAIAEATGEWGNIKSRNYQNTSKQIKKGIRHNMKN